ncbi:MAG: thermonuclease family protein [Xenococcaceae cyanobacterium MO_167.B27]|nr:thermonuclease family protein [Xenococcaceae cyanobacterium MO_167.B27]
MMRDQGYEVNQILVRIITVGCLLLLLGCNQTQPDSNQIPARVERIISGQTLEVIINSNNQAERVRIVGIDVPASENRKIAAKKALQNLIPDPQIYLELESPKRDRYDRILAHVWHNKALVSEALAKKGYVLANTKYPNQYSDRIFYAQEYARILGYGIWSTKEGGIRNEE